MRVVVSNSRLPGYGATGILGMLILIFILLILLLVAEVEAEVQVIAGAGNLEGKFGAGACRAEPGHVC